MNLTKQALVDTITQELGVGGTPISKVQVEAVLGRYAVIAVRALKAGGELPLPGIGKLKGTIREARIGRNPATGQPIDIPAKRVVSLTVSKVLKDTINED